MYERICARQNLQAFGALGRHSMVSSRERSWINLEERYFPSLSFSFVISNKPHIAYLLRLFDGLERHLFQYRSWDIEPKA